MITQRLSYLLVGTVLVAGTWGCQGQPSASNVYDEPFPVMTDADFPAQTYAAEAAVPAEAYAAELAPAEVLAEEAAATIEPTFLPEPAEDGLTEDDFPDPGGSSEFAVVEVPARELSVTAAPTVLNQMTWDGGTIQCTGNDPYAIFALDQPEFVHQLRLTYRLLSDQAQPVQAQVFWKMSGLNDFVEQERNARFALETGGGQQSQTIPINDTIDHLRIDPADGPCALEVTEITLVLSPTEPTSSSSE